MTDVAILHDIVEDTDYAFNDLRNMGFESDVIEAFMLMRHDKSVAYVEYVEIIKANPIVRVVKLADFQHNSDLSRLEIVDEKALKRKEKYCEAIRLLTD